jgi:hypothetical protein
VTETDEVEPRTWGIEIELAHPADPYGAILEGSWPNDSESPHSACNSGI